MATARIKFYKRNKSLENGRQQEKEPTLFYEAWCEIRNLYGQELYEALDVRLENAIEFEGDRYDIYATDFKQNDRQYVQLKANRRD